MEKYTHVFLTVEFSLIAISFITAILGQIFGLNMVAYMKKNLKKSWTELSGAEFNGEKWIGGSRRIGSKGIKYIFSEKDNHDLGILEHKKQLKTNLFVLIISLSLVFLVFFGFIVLWFLLGCPKIS